MRKFADTVSGDLWASILTNCAKLVFKVSPEHSDEAFVWLLELKSTMPVIDQALAAVKLPGTIEKYLPSDELSHIDFQGSATVLEVLDQSSQEFRP